MTKNLRKTNSFNKIIKEIADSKKLAVAEREQIKKNLLEAIEQDQDSTKLYEDYRIKSKEIDGFDDKIRAEARNMPIYSKTPEGQDEMLAGDAVYELLKNENNKKLLKALMERKMTVDQYKALLYLGLMENTETNEQRILRVMEDFKSGLPLKIKVGKKGNGRGIKTLNDKGNFETMIGEEYILTRLSRYFSRTGISLDNLKASIQFPEGVKISRPEDTAIKFKCGGIEGLIKVEFVVIDSNDENKEKRNEESENVVENGGTEDNREKKEKLPERELLPKELFHCLEMFIKKSLKNNNSTDVNVSEINLAEADTKEIKDILELLNDQEMYTGYFCDEICKKDILKNLLENVRVKFPSNFKDFLSKIAPIELDEKKLIAILQSNYRRKGDGNKEKTLVFDIKYFRDYGDHPELEEKYRRLNDYVNHSSALTELQKEELKELRIEISQIERDIINKYYPHLKEVYFKDQMNFKN